MIYVFDTSTLITIFSYYYRDRFPTLWEAFDELVGQKKILMTEESLNEISDQNEVLLNWAKDHRNNFIKPSVEEALMVRKILAVPHFQQVIDRKKILKGGYVADPFIIAKAKVLTGTVVTMEKLKPNSAKIPNICKHFSVPCLTLETFMANENWSF